MKRLVSCLAAALVAFLAGNASAQSATATGISRDFNPAISVNTLLLYTSGLNEAEAHEEGEEEEHAHSHGVRTDGFHLQETEVQLTSYIDPYAKANLVFAMHGTDGFELEEGYAAFLPLPRGLALRGGKFYWEFGKHNAYHTHQFPFVERPYAWDALLGAHGLNGMAIETSWLTPLPWYAEVIAYGFPLTETVYGDHEIPANSWGGGAKIRQLWDLTEGSTLDLGLSYAGGGDPLRHFLGADLTYRWTGTGENAKEVEIQSEWFRRLDDREEGNVEADGLYIHGFARVSERIHLGGRFDLYSPAEEHEHGDPDDVLTYTASAAFVPSEFQAFRVDVLYRDLGEEDDFGVRTQYNFTIGSHPAHRY